MISLLVDHNFNEHIVDGLRRRDATVDLILVRDVGLAAASDPSVLESAALQGRVLLTHDRNTILDSRMPECLPAYRWPAFSS